MPTKYINEFVEDYDKEYSASYKLPPLMTKAEQLRRNKVTLKFNNELNTGIPFISDNRVVTDEEYELIRDLRKKYTDKSSYYATHDFFEWERSASNKNIKEQLKRLEEKLKEY